jgi:TonB family protein
LANLTKKIFAKLHDLRSAQRDTNSKGTVAIGFQVDKDGAIRSDTLKILARSGNEALDALALGSVQSSSPFEAFPDSLGTTVIEFRMTYRFRVLPDGPFRSLFESAQRSASNRDYSTAAQVLESLLDKDPDYTNGWNYLGYIDNQRGRDDRAVPALQKAVVQSPFDGYAYNNLGQAFAGLKKFEEAVPQYQKQIEINPKDRFAWANLGRADIRHYS